MNYERQDLGSKLTAFRVPMEPTQRSRRCASISVLQTIPESHPDGLYRPCRWSAAGPAPAGYIVEASLWTEWCRATLQALAPRSISMKLAQTTFRRWASLCFKVAISQNPTERTVPPWVDNRSCQTLSPKRRLGAPRRRPPGRRDNRLVKDSSTNGSPKMPRHGLLCAGSTRHDGANCCRGPRRRRCSIGTTARDSTRDT